MQLKMLKIFILQLIIAIPVFSTRTNNAAPSGSLPMDPRFAICPNTHEVMYHESFEMGIMPLGDFIVLRHRLELTDPSTVMGDTTHELVASTACCYQTYYSCRGGVKY